MRPRRRVREGGCNVDVDVSSTMMAAAEAMMVVEVMMTMMMKVGISVLPVNDFLAYNTTNTDHAMPYWLRWRGRRVTGAVYDNNLLSARSTLGTNGL